jgi:hypothetical protein
MVLLLFGSGTAKLSILDYRNESQVVQTKQRIEYIDKCSFLTVNGKFLTDLCSPIEVKPSR